MLESLRFQAWLSLVAVGCGSPSAASTPRVELAPSSSASEMPAAPSPAPQASASAAASATPPAAPLEHARFQFDPVDTAPFAQAGCKVFPGYMDCDAAPTLQSADCLGGTLYAPPWLTALSPREPVAFCWRRGSNDIARGNCMLSVARIVVVREPGGFRVFDKAADVLAKWGAPKTDEQFIAYGALFTDAYERETVVIPPGVRQVAIGPFHPTSVTPSKKGKKVELFAQRACGCGHHGERLVHAVVGLDGHLVESNEEMLWEDPSQDGLCVD